MTKRPSQQPFYSEQVVTLPANFAENVLQLQMKLDSDGCDLSCITQLNELYKVWCQLPQTAVEYFVSVDAKKATHFQKKLTHLLTNPRTLQLIEPRQKAKAELNKASELSSALKGEMCKFNTQAEHYVKNIIESSERKLQRSESLIRLSLNDQEDRLKNRLMQRTQSRKFL